MNKEPFNEPRPKTIWFVFILSAISLMIILFSFFGGFFELFKLLLNENFNPNYLAILLFFAKSFALISYLGFILVGVVKRRKYGWYLSVSFLILFAIFEIYTTMSPSEDGSLALRNIGEKVGYVFFGILVLVLLTDLTRRMFTEKCKKYFGIIER